MPKPLCFMIMPYGRKPTMVEQCKGPAEIDFNALWDKAFFPVIQELGYEPLVQFTEGIARTVAWYRDNAMSGSAVSGAATAG